MKNCSNTDLSEFDYKVLEAVPFQWEMNNGYIHISDLIIRVRGPKPYFRGKLKIPDIDIRVENSVQKLKTLKLIGGNSSYFYRKIEIDKNITSIRVLENIKNILEKYEEKCISDESIDNRKQFKTVQAELDKLIESEKESLKSDNTEVSDPFYQWIKENLDELRKYPDMFVALDPEHGILVHATEQDEFAAKLETLSPEENERVTLFHTSMYLKN